MRVRPGCAEAAEQLVRRCCPGAAQRPQHWQARQAGGGEGAAAAATAGTAGVEGEGSCHLSFAIPQQQADLASLFEALEGGR